MLVPYGRGDSRGSKKKMRAHRSEKKSEGGEAFVRI